jgi:hypothetical protein
VPHYHFDLVDSKVVSDEGGTVLAGDIEAMDAADEIAKRLIKGNPGLRNHHYSILVTNADGDEICRVPLDIIH